MISNYKVGHDAEKLVADYLEKHGFKIRAMNWRTRWCEIDIIAQKSKVVYFVEVKSRRSSEQGSGFDYITPSKLRQMRFAAEFWMTENNYDGECSLAAAEVEGEDKIEFIDELTP